MTNIRKQTITETILQYSFIEENSKNPSTITLLKDRNRTILIDVAYEKYAEILIEELSEEGIDNYTILISHHHEDHFDGMKAFKDFPSYASELFSQDVQTHLQTDDFLTNFMPTHFLEDGQILKFDSFWIKSIYTPGHNICEFSFQINEDILFVGDLIFSNFQDILSLPYLDESSTVSQYINSLTVLKALNPKILLSGHGKAYIGDDVIQEQFDKILFYLSNLQNLDDREPIEKFIDGEIEEYSNLNFHDNNLMRK